MENQRDLKSKQPGTTGRGREIGREEEGEGERKKKKGEENFV
jgi:hypothetical protein